VLPHRTSVPSHKDNFCRTFVLPYPATAQAKRVKLLVLTYIAYTTEQTIINHWWSFLLFIDARAIDAKSISFRPLLSVRAVNTARSRLRAVVMRAVFARAIVRTPVPLFVEVQHYRLSAPKDKVLRKIIVIVTIFSLRHKLPKFL